MLDTISQHMMASREASLEAWLSAANVALSSLEQVTVLNLGAARTLMEDVGAHAGCQNYDENMPKPVALKPLLDRNTAYSAAVLEIAAKTQEALKRSIEAHHSQWNDSVNAVVNLATRDGPEGTEVVVASIKTTLAAVNAAYDNIRLATSEMASIANDSAAVLTQEGSRKQPSQKLPKSAAKAH